MNFGTNLKEIRNKNGLSQEDLAELLNVSRQAVSKWEMDMGYPEVEKLLMIANKLHVSLDALMFSEISSTSNNEKEISGKICINSPIEGVVITCNKVIRSQKMLGGKNAPKYALFGLNSGDTSFWGEATTFLGWYANEELITQEIEEIYNAIMQGIATYTLQYNVKTTRKFMSVKIVEE